VQLHLEVELLRAAVADVDPDLAHRLDDVRPDRGSGFLASGLGTNAGGCVALEEGLRDLRAASVVRADEEDVLHRNLLSGDIFLIELVDELIHAL
jgi:hypothetical protein